MKKGRFSILTVTFIIAALGILAAMAVPQFSAYRARSSSSSRYLVDYAYQSSEPATLPAPPVDTLVTDFNTEEYDRIYENRFKDVLENPLSTFSIDVDTASYSNVRRFVQMNRIPRKVPSGLRR